jgi:hypothetical protein
MDRRPDRYRLAAASAAAPTMETLAPS